MPSLTPTQLAEARRRSGRLGGRPRKPTVEEARQVELAQLVPRALVVLSESLEREDEKVRLVAAREVFDRAWGRPVQGVRDETDPGVAALTGLSEAELTRLVNVLGRKLEIVEGETLA